ncbi:MAG: DUF11 domain-containing protein [Cocleimonas sp.]|nr:DUF11 domain-containing protein [Cocleimonas sp.]
MKIKIMKTLLSVAVLSAITSTASAAPIGTAAGTAVDNTASISYSVGGQNQTPIESSETGNTTPGTGNGTATTFVVDKKVDLLVTGATTTNVVPGQTGAADNTELTYTLTNEGNSTEDFTLTATDNLALAVGTDDFNSTGCTVTAPALPVTIASGDVVNVTVECDIPASSATVTNGAKSLVDLLAEVTGVTASSGADTVGCISGTPNTPSCVTDVVFADGTGTGTDVGGDRNAWHSATSTYIINTADLTVKKTQAVSEMTINGAAVTGNKYHIPGAEITYTITVSNVAGAASATGIILSDTVPNTMTVVGTPTVSIDAGPPTDVTSGSSNSVTSLGFDLNAGSTAVLTIIATVN